MAEFRLSNFTSGTALTAAELNTGLTFTDYTPTWTQGVTVTHTKNWARYTQFGKLVTGSINLTATTSGTNGQLMTVTLPVSASADNSILGVAHFNALQSGSGAFFALYNNSSTMSFGSSVISNFNGTLVGLTAGVSGTAPFTTLKLNFQYEAA